VKASVLANAGIRDPEQAAPSPLRGGLDVMISDVNFQWLSRPKATVHVIYALSLSLLAT